MRKVRIEDGLVAEVLVAEPFPPFHPSLVWVECEDEMVTEGWAWDGEEFKSPESILSLEEKLDRLWNAAHNYVISKIDLDARSKYLHMLTQDYVSSEQKYKINQNAAWTDSIWQGYYGRKSSLIENPQSSVSEDFSNYGNPPYTFWEIVND